MNGILKSWAQFFTSLRLTVVLLILSIVLVFVATLAQVQMGIVGVQQNFFHTFVVVAYWGEGRLPVPVFPGGYLIGGLLMINLTASLFLRLKFTARKIGIHFIHIGLMVLLLGELVSGLWQEDFALTLNEGQTKSYSEEFRGHELAIIDTSHPDHDEVVAIPASRLTSGEAIQHPRLPFRITIHHFYPNAQLTMRSQMGGDPSAHFAHNPANQGLGPRLAVTPRPLTYRDDERNQPTALVELQGVEGSLGIWLVSPMLVAPQTFEHEGKTYRLTLRSAREYKPFSITLLQLRHDVYPGSNIPKNFSSRVQVKAVDGSEDREALISMNHPLRHQGYTFYQYQMDQANGMSRLQVVRNPGYALPYIACILMTIGMLVQFSIHLFAFMRRRTT